MKQHGIIKQWKTSHSFDENRFLEGSRNVSKHFAASDKFCEFTLLMISSTRKAFSSRTSEACGRSPRSNKILEKVWKLIKSRLLNMILIFSTISESKHSVRSKLYHKRNPFFYKTSTPSWKVYRLSHGTLYQFLKTFSQEQSRRNGGALLVLASRKNASSPSKLKYETLYISGVFLIFWMRTPLHRRNPPIENFVATVLPMSGPMLSN